MVVGVSIMLTSTSHGSLEVAEEQRLPGEVDCSCGISKLQIRDARIMLNCRVQNVFLYTLVEVCPSGHSAKAGVLCPSDKALGIFNAPHSGAQSDAIKR